MASANRRLEERRAQHARYKEDVQREGKAFFPHAMFHDTVMSLVVVAVIIGLACVWYFTADGTEAGWLGPHYTEEADPGTTNFVPRPDWYFYFLFYLLRIFKWPETVVLGTVIVPTIALVLLLALPFADLRRERRLLRRPVALVAMVLTVVAMGVLTYKGATAEEPSGSEADSLAPEWAEVHGFEDDEQALAGATLFAESGCLNCHVYLGSGAANLGAPELSEIGAGDRDADYFANYVANPRDFGNNVMPVYGLAPRYQRTTARNRDTYESFWGSVDRVSVSDLSASAPGSVTATVTYHYADGRVFVERTSYRLVRDDGDLKIDRSTVLSSVQR